VPRPLEHPRCTWHHRPTQMERRGRHGARDAARRVPLQGGRDPNHNALEVEHGHQKPVRCALPQRLGGRGARVDGGMAGATAAPHARGSIGGGCGVPRNVHTTRLGVCVTRARANSGGQTGTPPPPHRCAGCAVTELWPEVPEVCRDRFSGGVPRCGPPKGYPATVSGCNAVHRVTPRRVAKCVRGVSRPLQGRGGLGVRGVS